MGSSAFDFLTPELWRGSQWPSSKGDKLISHFLNTASRPGWCVLSPVSCILHPNLIKVDVSQTGVS